MLRFFLLLSQASVPWATTPVPLTPVQAVASPPDPRGALFSNAPSDAPSPSQKQEVERRGVLPNRVAPGSGAPRSLQSPGPRARLKSFALRLQVRPPEGCVQSSPHPWEELRGGTVAARVFPKLAQEPVLQPCLDPAG